jgi:hypothetical protein
MALFSLLKIGIDTAIENERESFLTSFASNGIDEALALEALEAIKLFPEAFQKLTEVDWDANSPELAMVFLPVMTSYLLAEDDVIPAWDGSVLIGAIDDAYLTFSAAVQASDLANLEGFEKFRAPMGVLAKVLPDDMKERLDNALEDAMNRAKDRLTS